MGNALVSRVVVNRTCDPLFYQRSTPRFLVLLATTALWLLAPALAHAGGHQEKEALGSLSTAGIVFVNGSAAPAESTIFTGDTVLTGDTGTATFSASGKGSFKLSSQTHLMFAGDPRYLAEMTSGTVVVTSFAQGAELSVKVGGYVVSPVIQTAQSSTRIEKTYLGSYRISCVDGSVGILPIQGTAGQVLRSGQTVEISAEGQLGTPGETPASTENQAPANQPSAQKKKYTGWIILGAAGAGAAGIAAALAGHSSQGQSVSPSSM